MSGWITISPVRTPYLLVSVTTRQIHLCQAVRRGLPRLAPSPAPRTSATTGATQRYLKPTFFPLTPSTSSQSASTASSTTLSHSATVPANRQNSAFRAPILTTAVPNSPEALLQALGSRNQIV